MILRWFQLVRYLKHFPVDFIKIDGSFVRNLMYSSVDHTIVESINEVAHRLGVKTVAEYVEDDALIPVLVPVWIMCRAMPSGARSRWTTCSSSLPNRASPARQAKSTARSLSLRAGASAGGPRASDRAPGHGGLGGVPLQRVIVVLESTFCIVSLSRRRGGAQAGIGYAGQPLVIQPIVIAFLKDVIALNGHTLGGTDGHATER